MTQKVVEILDAISDERSKYTKAQLKRFCDVEILISRAAARAVQERLKPPS